MRLGADKVHSMDFLEYAYLQTGQNSKAMDMVKGVADVQDIEKSFSGYLNYARAHFPSLYALETHAWMEGCRSTKPASGGCALQPSDHRLRARDRRGA